MPASLGSVLGDAWGVWTYKRRGKDKGGKGGSGKSLIAELQVKQTLNEKR